MLLAFILLFLRKWFHLEISGYFPSAQFVSIHTFTNQSLAQIPTSRSTKRINECGSKPCNLFEFAPNLDESLCFMYANLL